MSKTTQHFLIIGTVVCFVVAGLVILKKKEKEEAAKKEVAAPTPTPGATGAEGV